MANEMTAEIQTVGHILMDAIAADVIQDIIRVVDNVTTVMSLVVHLILVDAHVAAAILATH